MLLYELLGGRKPFQGDSAASTMYKILHEVPTALDELDPAVGPPLTTLVDRAMAKAREDRYQRMTDLLRDLEAAYEPMRGADRRVISRVEAALSAPSGSRTTPPPGDYNPDNSPTISDETVPLTNPRPLTPAPVVAQGGATSQVKPRRTWLIGAVSLVLLGVAGWLVVGRQTPPPTEQAPATVTTAPPVAPTQPALPTPPPAPPAPEAPPIAAPQVDPPARPPRTSESSRDAAVAVDRKHASAALVQMDAGKAAAQAANARELAPQLYASAEREETRAREDLRQQRFAVAAARMESAATLFRSAAAAADAEKQAAEARARAAEEGRRRAEQAARQTPPATPPPATAPALPQPLPRPAPVPPSPAPAPAPAQPTAQEAVAATLRRYTSALEQRDVAALKAVWPGLSRSQQEAVEADFANARSISVELASPRIDVNGATATVTAVRHYSLRTRDGQQLRSDTTTTLTLRHAASGWLIESVSHRPLR